MRQFTALLAGILILFSANGQQGKKKKDKYASYFGIAVSPVLPNNFIGSTETSFKDTTQALTTTFTQKIGYSFGATARIGLTKTFSLETGLTQVRRNFDVHFSLPDSSINASDRMGFVNYDIPLNGLVYVQLFERIYMNAALGMSITHYPSDVHDTIITEDNHRLVMEGRRFKRTYFAMNAGIGFEWRTEKAGTFYLGGSAKIPLLPVFLGVGVVHTSQTSERFISLGRINGGYFSIDFRYFLPNIKQQGDQPLRAPNN